MKRFLIALILILLYPIMACPVSSTTGTTQAGVDFIAPAVTVPFSDSDVVFYLNCDSNAASVTPTKGTGPVLGCDGFTLTTGAVGSALTANAGYTYINVPVTSNLNLDVGTIGFYVYFTTITIGASIIYGDNSSPYFQLFPDSATELVFRYKTGIEYITVAAATQYFLELAWDGTAEKMAFRLNGASWVETTGLTGSDPSFTELDFGSYGSGTHNNLWYDQILISNVYEKDLYAERTQTSF